MIGDILVLDLILVGKLEVLLWVSVSLKPNMQSLSDSQFVVNDLDVEELDEW